MVFFGTQGQVTPVYQRTPEIAISEACVFLQGSLTRSLFLNFSLDFYVFSVKAYDIFS